MRTTPFLLLALCVAPLSAQEAEDARQTKIEKLCGEISDSIEAVLGRRFPGPVPVKMVDQEFIVDFARKTEERLVPKELRDLAQRMAERLYHVPQGFDMYKAQEELLRTAVAGLYDPETDQFYVVDLPGQGAGSPMFTITAAHELVHAYRDVDKDYWARVIGSALTDTDWAIGVSCLVEGDAQFLGEVLGFSFLQKRDAEPMLPTAAKRVLAMRAQLLSQPRPPAIAKFPLVMREMLIRRYVLGQIMAAAIYEKGGKDALDRAYDQPPRSSAAAGRTRGRASR